MKSVDMKRRTLFKAAGATAAGVWAAHVADAQVTSPAPYTTQPWLDPLPVGEALKPVNSLWPTPTAEVNKAAKEAGSRAPHPYFNPDPKHADLYEIEVKPGWHQFHKHMPSQMIIGYGGQIPAPRIHARYGRPVLIRFRNSIPEYLPGYGSPDISVHLHNMHTPSGSDGYPLDYWGPHAYGEHKGEYKDHWYPMREAGFLQMGSDRGDWREALGTLWYHDHRELFTAGNVYRGMAGFFLAFDEVDSGNETDYGNSRALRLPSGPYDVPLMVQDKKFDSSGYAVFNQLDQDGFIGDKFLVNGKIQPYFHVEPRKYRFRILAAGTSRVWDLQVRYLDRAQNFQQIASDGNLLEAPITRSNMVLGAAERNDIVVDFSKFPPGAELYLTNRLTHEDGRKPEKDYLPVPTQLLKFVVDKPLARPDYSQVPWKLREMPAMQDLSKLITRTFSFGRDGGAWTINKREFSENPRGVTPKMGSAEIWNLRNDSGGWVHPVHIHFEESRILQRNGRTPPAWERGRKDVFYLGPNENVRVYIAFRDFYGRYVMHCHNTIHEDHGMMMSFRIEPPTS
jgi:FtsP/CotA-like multicopper oxidase with cupredoxin domain